MAKLIFDEKEIEDDIEAEVNSAGLAYVGRKYQGKKVRILVMKGYDSIAGSLQTQRRS